MRVLVAGDDAIARRRLCGLLRQWGYGPLEAAGGRQALEVCQDQGACPDMLIADLAMAGLDGLGLADRLRQQVLAGGPYVYVLVLTSRDDPGELLAGFSQGGVDDYLAKPFLPQELASRLAVGARMLRLEREHQRQREGLEETVRLQTERLRQSQEEIMIRLFQALETRDEQTGEHMRRIVTISARLAEGLGWQDDLVDQIRVAAPMHDIGKLGVPDSVLLKPGRLTAGEFEVIKQHTVIGGRILENSHQPLVRMAWQIALHHHERWDGRGYPHGLAGEDIPLAARVVAVADVYDALTSDRVYRPGMAGSKALAIIRQGRGNHFDPRLVDLFLDLPGELLGLSPGQAPANDPEPSRLAPAGPRSQA